MDSLSTQERDGPVVLLPEYVIDAGAEVLLDAGDDSGLSCHELAGMVFRAMFAKLPYPVIHENGVSLIGGAGDIGS